MCCGVSCVLLESRGHQLAGDENVLRGSACTVAGELIRMILLRNFVTVLQNKADGDKSGFHSLRRALAKYQSQKIVSTVEKHLLLFGLGNLEVKSNCAESRICNSF